MKRFRLSLIMVAMIALGIGTSAPSAFAWSPLSVSAPCSTDGVLLNWTVQGDSEASLNIDFAFDSAFSTFKTYALDSTTFSVLVPTGIVPEVWVRWTGDTTVGPWTGLAPTGCTHNVIAPAGSIGGPCADPSYYGVFDNSATTSQSIWFRMRWVTMNGLQTVKKLVPAGAIYKTWVHWARFNTKVKVGYKDPTTGIWKNLASLTAGRGSFPPCQYTPGWVYP